MSTVSLRLLVTLILFAGAPAYADEATAWAALREGGHIILMRHATTTPGTGDPPNFRLGDCTTQRLLSDAGRGQAKAIGAMLREQGIKADRVRAAHGAAVSIRPNLWISDLSRS